MQAPPTATMTEEGGKSRSSSLEKQRRFLGRERYMSFQDEPLHASDSGGLRPGPWPEQALRAVSGIPFDVSDGSHCIHHACRLRSCNSDVRVCGLNQYCSQIFSALHVSGLQA